MSTQNDPVPVTYYVDEGRLGRHEIALLSLRLIAIYALLQGIRLLGLVGVLFRGSTVFGQTIEALPYLLPDAIHLVLGILLWIYAPKLAHRLLPDTAAGPELRRATTTDFQAIAFSVAGAVIVVLSVPELIMALLQDSEQFDMRQWIGMHSIRTALGAILFFGGRTLARFWHHLRHGESIAPSNGHPPHVN